MMTLSDFAAKVDNEGGLYEAVVGYGLSHKDINRNDDPELYDLLEQFVEEARELDNLRVDIDERLEDHYDY